MSSGESKEYLLVIIVFGCKARRITCPWLMENVSFAEEYTLATMSLQQWSEDHIMLTPYRISTGIPSTYRGNSLVSKLQFAVEISLRILTSCTDNSGMMH